VGAGMALRRGAAIAYLESLQTQERVILDRTGTNLSSGGDCDINLTILEAGWSVGYFPQLKLDHLIPAGRLTQDYLGRLNQSVMRSWVQVLDAHDIRPWTKIPAWTLPLRNLRSFLRCQAWRDPAAYIRWQGTCGLFLGRAQLSQQEK
jgi:hypothetical protein